jgi:hypothetical protein
MTLLGRLLAALAFLLVPAATIAQTPGPGHPAPAYLGSAACADCHAAEAAAWRGSMHELAWQVPSEAAVLGDFGDTVFEHRGVATRFGRRDGAFVVETQGADGTPATFEVVGVAGVAPLQQYLVETEPGRLQALDVAWDVAGRRWYHLYPDADLPPGDGLHWTGPYKNWNARCAECHATGYAKNYEPQARHYASTQSEIGVGCEACHGPGEAHAEWARSGTLDTARWPGPGASGLTVDLAAGAEVQIQQCAGCHSRRESLADASPLPGTPFHDAYRLLPLREGLYHADGAIQDEVYVYGSFLQSKMYARGVRCTDCHDPHLAALELAGNAVCARCHSPAGNPRFPSLTPAAYDDTSHHFHAPGSAGAQCVSCHMIQRVYMGIDGRRDHSFRVPRPDLAAETGAPDACTDCHTDRDAAWAAAEIARRFPDSTRRGPHFSQAFAAARRDPAAAAETTAAIAEASNLPGIVRATAIDLLRGTQDPALASRLAALVADPDPLVREAAVGAIGALPPAERVRRLAPALEDPLRSVRIAAARAFLAIPPGILPPRLGARVEAAMADWRTSLLARADFPETQLAIGGAALALRNPAAAEQAFGEAVRLDPQLADGWAMIARIRAALGDAAGAREALDAALEANPGNAALLELREALRAASGQ